ncbi:MAG: pitrilysin family protein [Polyangiaceae bacterium]
MSAARAAAHVRPAETDLGGGATLVVESSHALPLVWLTVSLKSGTTLGSDDDEGLLRLTSRLMRRACEGMTTQEIDATIDRLGAELVIEVGPSAVTWHGQVLKKNVAAFCALIAKLFGAPTFPEDELARLKRETCAEIVESRDSDRSLAAVAFRRAVFGDHPYARRATGRIATIERFGRDDVLACRARHYVRGSLVIGFAGAVSPDEAARHAEAIAASLPASPAPPRDLAEPTIAPGRRLVFVDKPERTQTQLIIGGLGSSTRDPDHFALSAAMAIFGGTFTSRLMKEVRSKRGWSYGASARLSLERRRHAFSMGTAPGAADAAKCIALELELLQTLVDGGVTARELSFIQRYLSRSHAFEVDTAQKRLEQVTDEILLELTPGYHADYVRRVEEVTVEAAAAALAARISTRDLVITVVGTASELLDEVKAAVPDLASVAVIPYDAD